MIERLEGQFLEVGPSHVLVDLGGIGIRVLVPRRVADGLEAGRRGVLHTRLLVRDGDPQLFGFAEPEERAAFDALLGVGGVGPRIGLAILSFLDPRSLALAIESGRTEALVAAPGVGRKLASRIVLELRGRLPIDDGAGPRADGGAAGGTSSADGDVGLDAVRALTSLGYALPEAREAIRRVLQERGGEKPALDELLREALTSLNRAR